MTEQSDVDKLKRQLKGGPGRTLNLTLTAIKMKMRINEKLCRQGVAVMPHD